MDVFGIQSGIMLLVFFVLLAIKIYAFVSSLTFSAESYEVAGKLTQARLDDHPGPGGRAPAAVRRRRPHPDLAFTIAALVYLADVRPPSRAHPPVTRVRGRVPRHLRWRP